MGPHAETPVIVDSRDDEQREMPGWHVSPLPLRTLPVPPTGDSLTRSGSAWWATREDGAASPRRWLKALAVWFAWGRFPKDPSTLDADFERTKRLVSQDPKDSVEIKLGDLIAIKEVLSRFPTTVGPPRKGLLRTCMSLTWAIRSAATLSFRRSAAVPVRCPCSNR